MNKGFIVRSSIPSISVYYFTEDESSTNTKIEFPARTETGYFTFSR